mmetsp:Transcript_66213/g.185108  ORF Transcript_66213/g.185108 Transcript_66213/m.185108 type:complete len:223 (-) Transcript_66213:451-1119(-)
MVLPPRPSTQLYMSGSTSIDSSTNSTSALAASMFSCEFPRMRTVLSESCSSLSTIRTFTSYLSCKARMHSPPLPMILGTRVASTLNSTECLYPVPSILFRLVSNARRPFSRLSWKSWMRTWCLTCTSRSFWALVMALASPKSFKLPFCIWMNVKLACSSIWQKQPCASGVDIQEWRPGGSLKISCCTVEATSWDAGVTGRSMSFSTIASPVSRAEGPDDRAT